MDTIDQAGKKRRSNSQHITGSPSNVETSTRRKQHAFSPPSAQAEKLEKPINPSEIDTADDNNSKDDVIDLGKSSFPPSHPTGSYMGPSHAEDPYLVPFMRRNPATGLVPFVTRAIRPVEKHVAFLVYERDCECDSAIRAIWDSKYEQIEETVAPHKEQLIALFFRFIDWTYPAVDKKRFYRSYFHQDPPMHRGLMCTMLGLGCTYWKYSTQLCTKPIPPKLVQELWRLGLYYIEHDIDCLGASIDTVTALLLYLQKRIAGEGIHEQVTTRLHVGTLTSLSFSLGLHLDASDWDISPIEKTARSRLWALVYYSEKWSAANLGHPSLLGGMHKNYQYKFESQWHKERQFVELIKITNILSKTLDQLYTKEGDDDLPPLVIIERAQVLIQELQTWRASLPEDIVNIKAKNELKYCSNGMVHLSALTVEVLIVRHLLRPTFGGRFRHEARDLVLRIITFCLDITHAQLHAFWISPCRLSLSALAHFVLRYHAQSSESERKRNTPLMRSWNDSLRSLSHGWEEGIGLAYHRMDALFYRGKTDLDLPMKDSSYEEFVKSLEMERLQREESLRKSATSNSGAPSPAGVSWSPAQNTGQSESSRLPSEEPLGLDDDFRDSFRESPSNVLFADDNLHDLLYDMIWE